MKKYLLCFLLLPSLLIAKPYYSEYDVGDEIIIFHGNVSEEQEALAHVLERRFMDEALRGGDIRQKRFQIVQELEKIGISVKIIDNAHSDAGIHFIPPNPPPIEEDFLPPPHYPY